MQAQLPSAHARAPCLGSEGPARVVQRSSQAARFGSIFSSMHSAEDRKDLSGMVSAFSRLRTAHISAALGLWTQGLSDRLTESLQQEFRPHRPGQALTARRVYLWLLPRVLGPESRTWCSRPATLRATGRKRGLSAPQSAGYRQCLEM